MHRETNRSESKPTDSDFRRLAAKRAWFQAKRLPGPISRDVRSQQVFVASCVWRAIERFEQHEASGKYEWVNRAAWVSYFSNIARFVSLERFREEATRYYRAIQAERRYQQHRFPVRFAWPQQDRVVSIKETRVVLQQVCHRVLSARQIDYIRTRFPGVFDWARRRDPILSQAEAARELGISRAAAHKTEKTAFAHLRRVLIGVGSDRCRRGRVGVVQVDTHRRWARKASKRTTSKTALIEDPVFAQSVTKKDPEEIALWLDPENRRFNRGDLGGMRPAGAGVPMGAPRKQLPNIKAPRTRPLSDEEWFVEYRNAKQLATRNLSAMQIQG